MQKSTQQRREDEAEVLEMILSSVNMFKEQKEKAEHLIEMSNKQYYKFLADSLEYKYVRKGEALFHQGELHKNS